MSVKILFVDDHPSQIMGYKTILAYNDQNLEIDTTECHNCKEAFTVITQAETDQFDIVFLDRSMPPYEEAGVLFRGRFSIIGKKTLARS